MSPQVEAFWQKFLASLPAGERPAAYAAWAFGNTPEMKDELAALVLHGPKRATTSLAWVYEKLPEVKLPQIGEFSVILNAKDEPVCIIETHRLEKRKFREIDEAYAFTEGEGDRSLAYWRAGHWRYFEDGAKEIGLTASEDMPVICEYFRVVYPTRDR